MADDRALQDLQDDIDLYQGLLGSLQDLKHSQAAKEEIKHYEAKLAELTKKKARMGASFSRSETPSSPASQSHGSDQSGQLPATSTSGLSEVPTWGFKNLPSRKRERGDLDDETDNDRTKSRKSTPLESPRSRAASVSSDFFDDPNLTSLIGDTWKDDLRRNRDYERRQAAKRQQEEEDAALARRLQEQWSQPELSSQPNSKPYYPLLQQATFRPNGSFERPSNDAAPSGIAPGIRPTANEDASTPISVSSSEDDLTFTTSDDWRRLNPAARSRVLPSFASSQAGASRHQPAYSSIPGSSVYGSATRQGAFNGLPSLPSLQSLASIPGIGGMLGSSQMPFDLTRLLGNDSVLPQNWETPDPQEVQEEIRQLLHNIRPDEEIDISEAGENQPEGLKVRLMPHQVKGVAWMKKMEESSTKGGILADDMGLGKTVQAIALMLSRPPPENAKRPTLIVTPLALMEQWKREMSKMVRHRNALSVLILHGSKAHTPWENIKHFDVILTSYGTLSTELKRRNNWDEARALNPDAKRAKKFELSVMDEQAKFHRIILDEAQNIKNRNTQGSVAACRLQATYRWCLSGTPMQNSVEEIYSLIRFCRIRPYNEFEKFSKDIARPLKRHYETGQDRAMEKLQALLKAILLRRTKKSEIDGEPILQLPEKSTTESRAIFDKDQLEFYQALERKSQIQFNRYVKAGTVGKNYATALVLLLRLRQCCCSPQLITNSKDFVMDSGVEGIDLIANAKELPTAVVNRIKEQDDIECPICMDAVENPIIFNPCGHTLCHDCFSRMIDSVQAENAENVKCPHCRARIDSKKITDYTSFKDVYLGDGAGNRDAETDMDAESGSDDDSESVASDDSSSFGNDDDDGGDLKDFVVADENVSEASEESEDEDDLDLVRRPKKPARILANPGKPKTQKKKKRSKGKKKEKEISLAELRKQGLKSRAAKKKYLKQLGKIYERCAKIDKTLDILKEIHARGEGEKAIVFSNFTSFLDLVEVPLSQQPEFANYTRYDGSMTAKDRNEAVLKFTDDPNCRVMLISLKAGNAGLNLTIANHVLILDPFWNPFVEYQAADRCHRIGQRREVTVHRVLIGEEGIDHEASPEHVFTVEDRILQLQEKKRRLVENALDENAAQGITRLGVRELGFLFGVNDIPPADRS